MSEESQEKRPFEDAIEILLTGIPEMLRSIIRTLADELTFQGWQYTAVEEGEISTLSFAKFMIKVWRKENHGSTEDSIGIITVQELPGGQTLFRVPPCGLWDYKSYWDLGDGKRLPTFLRPESFNVKVNESFFTQFLIHLFAEFQRLGFVDFKEEKPPLGFKLPHREKDVQSF